MENEESLVTQALRMIEKRCSGMSSNTARFRGYRTSSGQIVAAVSEMHAYDLHRSSERPVTDRERMAGEMAEIMLEHATDETLSECMERLDDLLTFNNGVAPFAVSPLAQAISEDFSLWGRKILYRGHEYVEMCGLSEGLFPWYTGAPDTRAWRERFATYVERHLRELPDGEDSLLMVPAPDDLEIRPLARTSEVEVLVPVLASFHEEHAAFQTPDPRHATDEQIGHIAARVALYLQKIDEHRSCISDAFATAVRHSMIEAHGSRDLTVLEGRVRTVTFEAMISPDPTEHHPVRNIWIVLRCLAPDHNLLPQYRDVEVVAFPGGHSDLANLRTAITKSRKRGDALRAMGDVKRPALTDPLMAAFLTAMTSEQRRQIHDFLTVLPGRTYTRKQIDDHIGIEMDERIETLTLKEGRVNGRIRIAPGISWNGGHLLLKGYRLPKATIMAMAGRPFTDVVESPLLEGLTILKATASRSGEDIRFIIDSEDHPIDDIIKARRTAPPGTIPHPRKRKPR